MARKKKHPEHINHERWLVSYADFITLLFAFFVVMFAVSQVDSKKMGRFSESFAQATGIVPMPFAAGGKSIEVGAADPTNGDPAIEAGGGAGELQAIGDAIAGRAGKDGGLNGLQLIRGKNELVIRLADSVIFDSGDDRLKDTAVRALRIIAEEVRKRAVALRVEGHTDNIRIRNARFRSNWELSTSRATAVIASAENGQILPERLSAAGYGEFHPIADNDKPESRAQNRRVDLVITALPRLALASKPASSAQPAASTAATQPKPDAKPELKAESAPSASAAPAPAPPPEHAQHDEHAGH